MWSRFGAFGGPWLLWSCWGLVRQLSLSASTFKVRACVALPTSLRDDQHEKHLATQRDNSDQDGAPKGEARR
jgi:hypothetical protein